MNRKAMYLSTIDSKAQELAKAYGLGLEIAEYCTAENMDDKFQETDEIVREKMQYAKQWILHGPFNELFPCAIDPKARELAAFRYRQTLELAKNYGIHKVVLHGGYNPKLYYPCWYVEQSIGFWSEFVKSIPEDMIICLENVFEEEADMLLEIVQAVNDERIRICLDVGHVNAYSEQKVTEWAEKCADYIAHFHIHNNDGEFDSHDGLNKGTILMEELLEWIQNKCPEATITLEVIDVQDSLQWLEEKKFMEA